MIPQKFFKLKLGLVILITLINILNANAAPSTTYYSVANGAWASSSTWSLSSGGSPISIGYHQAGHNVIIATTTPVTFL